MSTKQQVVKYANQLGAKLDITSNDIALHAPHGKVLGGELHISVYDLELYKRSEIWNSFMYELMTMTNCEGSDYCKCGN